MSDTIMCEFNTNLLFCCFTDRPFGVKMIGFLYFCLHFLGLVYPIYELNVVRSNASAYENATFFEDIPFLQGGGYENLLVFGIIFFLVGIVCSAVLVWGTMQVFC